MKRILGIDPGITGGLALVERGLVTGSLVVEPMPAHDRVLDLPGMVRWIRAHKPEIRHAYVEKVAAMPKNGSIGCFKLGDCFGAIKGILTALEIPFTLVTPLKWKNQMLSGIEKLEDKKAMSAIAASRLFPGFNFLETERCRRPHSGMVEAALIAEYGLREMEGRFHGL